jgi:hypothetical protein
MSISATSGLFAASTRSRSRESSVRRHRKGENPARWCGHLQSLLAAPVEIAKVQHYPALPYHEIGAFMVSSARSGAMLRTRSRS